MGMNRFAATGRFIGSLLPLLAALGVIVPLALGQPHLSLLGSYLAVPMVAAPLLYRAAAPHPFGKVYLPRPQDRSRFYLLAGSFFMLYAAAVVLLRLAPVRPHYFYWLAAAMALLLLAEILWSRLEEDQQLLVLGQLMLLMLALLWGVNLKYYYFIGRTDPLAHSWFIESILRSGHVGDVFDVYKPFPLWHIFNAGFQLITDWPWPTYRSMFFINGLIYAMLLPTLYLVGLRLFQRPEPALLTALFACLNPDVVLYYGMSSLARSVVSYLLAVLFLLLLQRREQHRLVLALFLTVGIILYHTASMPFVLFILGVVFLLQHFYQVPALERPVTLNYLLLATTLTLVYWIYYAQQLFRTLVENIVLPAPTGIITKSILLTPLTELANYLQFTPLLLFLLLGALAGLRSRQLPSLTKVVILVGLAASFLTFPGPSLLLNKLARSLNFTRFGEYTYMFICLAAAAGVSALFHTSRRWLRLATLALFLVMAVLSVSNDFNASDNPLVKRPFYTFYLTEAEVGALNQLAVLCPGYVMTDYVGERYLENTDYSFKRHYLEADPAGTRLLRQSSNDLLVIRSGELSQRPLKLYTVDDGQFKLRPGGITALNYYYNDLPVWNSLEEMNKVYDSRGVAAYN